MSLQPIVSGALPPGSPMSLDSQYTAPMSLDGSQASSTATTEPYTSNSQDLSSLPSTQQEASNIVRNNAFIQGAGQGNPSTS